MFTWDKNWRYTQTYIFTQIYIDILYYIRFRQEDTLTNVWHIIFLQKRNKRLFSKTLFLSYNYFGIHENRKRLAIFGKILQARRGERGGDEVVYRNRRLYIRTVLNIRRGSLLHILGARAPGIYQGGSKASRISFSLFTSLLLSPAFAELEGSGTLLLLRFRFYLCRRGRLGLVDTGAWKV